VIHTVGPIWRGGGGGEAELLVVVSIANRCCWPSRDNLQSIAFPAISCGIYSYPPEQASAIAVRTIISVGAVCPAIMRVVLVAFEPPMVKILKTAVDSDPNRYGMDQN